MADDEVTALTLSFGDLTVTLSRSRGGPSAAAPPTARGRARPPAEEPRQRGPSAQQEPQDLDPEEEWDRIYVVTRNPHDLTSLGIWVGNSTAVWTALASTLRGGRLFGSGATRQRVQTVAEARGVWRSACRSRGGPRGEPRIHHH